MKQIEQRSTSDSVATYAGKLTWFRLILALLTLTNRNAIILPLTPIFTKDADIFGHDCTFIVSFTDEGRCRY